MAVFRVEKTRDYTVMSNFHLKDRNLSLKSKGLLSIMLSLPNDWSYTIRGLAAICKEGSESISSALRELEGAGYIIRTRQQDDRGRMCGVEYVIFEQPRPLKEPDSAALDSPAPVAALPNSAMPGTAVPQPENPITETAALSNTKGSNTNVTSTDIPNTQELNPYLSDPCFTGIQRTVATGWDQDGMGRAVDMASASRLRETVRLNIEYDVLSADPTLNPRRLDEIVELVVEALCSTKPFLSIAGSILPADMVRERLLKLNASHIYYIFECLDRTSTSIRNIKQYLLTTLFNAAGTMDSYVAASVNHDLMRLGYGLPGK